MLWLSVPSSCLHWVVLLETFSTKMLMKSKISEAWKYTCLLSLNFLLLGILSLWCYSLQYTLNNVPNTVFHFHEFYSVPAIRVTCKIDSQEARKVSVEVTGTTHFPNCNVTNYDISQRELGICHTIKWQIIFFRHTF